MPSSSTGRQRRQEDVWTAGGVRAWVELLCACLTARLTPAALMLALRPLLLPCTALVLPVLHVAANTGY